MRTLTEERRQAIIQAAVEVFQEQGYERTSMNEVARRVGGSKATLYNYFASKEELFAAVVRTFSTQFLTQAASELASAESQLLSLEEKLTRFGTSMLQVLTGSNPALQLYRIVVGEAGHSDIGALFRESGIRESMETLARVMGDAVQQGELRDAEPMLLASQFTALVRAETDALLLKREIPLFSREQISAMVTRAVRLFLYGAAAA
ncbi:TetR/AcrR family transcriptional regulator [Kosakonia radicincitans]|uniref:TetR/AcrR family transcriptional regulator n=1 Tax=Kosakonia radicincitans TaxID=283686 RepID=UPI0005C2B92A|nr:TetR/AcrR family transcriptional regulator [Kosakonia radicincitans]KIS44757.1 bacterial regulatory s, tetR family protein [Kosakonia radicincitans YD4]